MNINYSGSFLGYSILLGKWRSQFAFVIAFISAIYLYSVFDKTIIFFFLLNQSITPLAKIKQLPDVDQEVYQSHAQSTFV
jgi:hypothetical protein